MISRKIVSWLLIWNSLGTCVYREMSTKWQTASLTCAYVVSSCLESPMMFGVLSLEYPIRKCNLFLYLTLCIDIQNGKHSYQTAQHKPSLLVWLAMYTVSVFGMLSLIRSHVINFVSTSVSIHLVPNFFALVYSPDKVTDICIDPGWPVERFLLRYCRNFDIRNW